MVTKDDIVMTLFRNIDSNAVNQAKNNGTLLSYFGEIADKIMGICVNTSTSPSLKAQIDHGSGIERNTESPSIRSPTPHLKSYALNQEDRNPVKASMPRMAEETQRDTTIGSMIRGIDSVRIKNNL